MSLGSESGIFAFDGDGICSGFYGVIAGCPFGETGYEGPGTSFIEVSPELNTGVVSFSGGVAPGGSAYFSLEAPLTANSVVSGGPSLTEQGGGPNFSEHHTTCSVGQPVNCATGVLWHEFTDASVPGRGVPLKLARTYSSLNGETDGPLGFGWTDSYNLSLSVDSETGAATVHEEGGSQTTFPSNGSGGFTAPPRVLASLAHNEDGTYTFSRFADHIQYVFSAGGQLMREVDRNGDTTTLVYSGGQLERVTDPSGRSLTFSYTGSHIRTIADPLGRTTTYSYDSSGNLTGTTDALGRSWQFAYDASHRLLSMTDPRGGTTSNTYDSSGRVTAQTDPAGRTMSWAYLGDPTSSEGSTTTLTDVRGDVTLYRYQNLELASVTHGVGTGSEATTSYRYDPTTLGVSMVTDPNGNTTRDTYNERGDLATITDPLGRTTRLEYNGFDEPTFVTEPRGTTTSYAYDSAGNLLERSAPLTETGEVARTTYSYEAEPGEVSAVTDPNGHTTNYAYDSAGNRVGLTDADGNTTTSNYNADGELIAKVAPAGNVSGGNPGAHTTAYSYNAGGELTSETDPLGHIATYSYDGDGNRTSVTDANGHTTKQSYDADNELTEVTRPNGSTLQTHWDASGNMAAQIDAAGHLTSYAYDPLNRLISTTNPDGQASSYSYDAAGHKIASTDAEGQVTSYGYDQAGELTSIFYSDGQTPAVSESYDENGNRVSLNDGSGTSTYTYDSLGRMISATDGSGSTVQYAYDLAGRLTGLTYPNGQNVAREYDAAGHLTSVTDWLGHTTKFSYDADSNLNEQQYPNSVNTQLSYDHADRLTAISNKKDASTLASFNYVRDATGQVTTETANNGEPSTTNYTRDALDQLTTANTTPYGYDAADNPTTFGASTTQTFDAASELMSASAPGTIAEPPGGGPSGKEGSPPPSAPGPSTQSKTTPSGTVEPFQTAQAPSPTVDAVVSAVSRAKPALTTPRLRTHGSHDLVLAFVSASGVSRVTGITSRHLRWSLVTRNDSTSGVAEIWKAQATGRLGGPVTVRLRGPAQLVTATVAAFGGGAFVATHGASHGRASAPTNGLTPPAGALLWAVGHSTGQATAVHPHAGQRLVTQFFDKRSHTDGWVQQILTAAASAHLADTAPAAHWTLLAVAISARPAQAARATRVQAPTGVPDHTGSAIAESRVISPATSLDRGARTSTTGLVTRQFRYNARGDRIEETIPGSPSVALTYDQADRLVAVGSTIAYAYNGDGLRVSKTVGGAATQFVWNQAESLPELLQDGATYYIYGAEGKPIEQISGATPTYLHRDQQGSTRLLTDAAGNVVGRYAYSPWGAVTSHTGTAATNLQYDGQYTDSETGFQYLRARYYDPVTGQFLSQDLAFAATRNRYGFAAQNPLTFGDAAGLSWWNPFSWTPSTWRTVGEVAGAVGIVTAGVALCAATACIGDAALGAIGGAELIGGGAEFIGTGAAVVGGAADIANAANDCYLHSNDPGAGNCGTDIAVGVIDAATFGLGNGLYGGRFIERETTTIIRNSIGLTGGSISFIVSHQFWTGC